MTSPLLAEITQLWAKSFANDEAAYASREFKRLCDIAAEVYCLPGSPFELKNKSDVAMHATDMRNALKNIGAPWNADLPLPPPAAAEAIDKAYAALSCMLTHLIPFDLVDAAIGKKERNSTKLLKRRIETLLGGKASGDTFDAYFDIRSGYVHGRQLQDPNLWQRDLAGARRLARRVAYETLKLASDNRDWSRADLLQYLDR